MFYTRILQALQNCIKFHSTRRCCWFKVQEAFSLHKKLNKLTLTSTSNDLTSNYTPSWASHYSHYTPKCYKFLIVRIACCYFNETPGGTDSCDDDETEVNSTRKYSVLIKRTMIWSLSYMRQQPTHDTNTVKASLNSSENNNNKIHGKIK